MSKAFQFKQFLIEQDRCAMKIGTDGVLLGAWTSLLHKPQSILDIGAGTGVIALMLAQRSDAATIDGIELDDNAYEQCVANFENAIWADRLFCYHASLDEFVNEIEDQYDLIVSNPPFYSEIMPSGDTSRDIARQNQALPFHNLLQAAAQLMTDRGSFSTIIPYKEEKIFLDFAAKNNLYPKRITHVKGSPTSNIKRSLIALIFGKTSVEKELLTIATSRHKYTEEYIALTKEFYLKM